MTSWHDMIPVPLAAPETKELRAARFRVIAAVRNVVDQAGASNVAIDPRLFRSFRVDRVPTYVALSSDFEPCDQLDCVTTPPPHNRVAGNVSVGYVLETFSNANGPGAPVSRVALANYRSER